MVVTTEKPVKKDKKTKKTKKPSKQDLLDRMMSSTHLVTEADYVKKVGAIPSGSIALDRVLGIGGYPRSSVINVYGPESSGKSLISMMAIAALQKVKGTAVIWDVERSYSKNTEWMRTNGVDTSKVRFLRLRADDGCEVGMQEIESMIKANVVDLIVVDSVPAMIPMKALGKAMTKDDIMAATANVLTRWLRRIVPMLDESETSIMFIDQMRANTQRYGKFSPVKKETTIWALKHFSNIRIDVRRVSKIKKVDDIPYSHRIQVECVKNKVARPGLKCELELVYTSGINKIGEVCDIFIDAFEIRKSGKSYTYEGMKYVGRTAIEDVLSVNFQKAEKKAIELVKNMKTIGIKKPDDDDDEDDIMTRSLSIEDEG